MKFVRFFFATVVALLFVMGASVAVSAEPAFVSLSMDRATIAPGENVTFTVRATPQTTHVFASVEGVHVPAIRGAGNNWSVTVAPVRSTTVSVFANDENEELNAAEIRVPITVGVAGVTQPGAQPGAIPPVPADLAPLAIHYITETNPERQGWIQLTVVTGRDVTEVWANFDRVNNVRATGRFARARQVSADTVSRVWTINFDPAQWSAQTVEVGANRAYRWEGATTQTYTLTLARPFMATATGNARINNVTTSPRNPSLNRTATFTISTSHDVEYVWVSDPSGREFNATRTTTTQAQRTWSVTFTPDRRGNHEVFANSIRDEENAARRNVRIADNRDRDDRDRGDGEARIIGTPTAVWVGRDTSRIRVTTNAETQSVWVQMPGETRRTSLHRVNAGTGNRIWETEVFDSRRIGDIRVSVSSLRGNINNLDADDSRNVRHDDFDRRRDGEIRSAVLWDGRRNVEVGRWAEFVVTTSADVDALDVTGGNVHPRDVEARISRRAGGELEWWVEVEIRSGSGNTHLRAHAYVGGTRVHSYDLPTITIN